VTNLQTAIAEAADRAGTHATAPALLVQAMAHLGQLAASSDVATESGRRPFRTGPDWDRELAQLAYTVYLLADQTDVDLDDEIRGIAGRVAESAVIATAHHHPRTDDWI
jgi:hypothetical protein